MHANLIYYLRIPCKPVTHRKSLLPVAISIFNHQLRTLLTTRHNNRIDNRCRTPFDTFHRLEQNLLNLTSFRNLFRHHAVSRCGPSYSRVIWDLWCERNVQFFICGFGSDTWDFVREVSQTRVGRKDLRIRKEEKHTIWMN